MTQIMTQIRADVARPRVGHHDQDYDSESRVFQDKSMMFYALCCLWIAACFGDEFSPKQAHALFAYLFLDYINFI